MDATIKKQLQATACKVRMGVIEGTYNAKSASIQTHHTVCLRLADFAFCRLGDDEIV